MSTTPLLDDERLTRDEASARAELITISDYEIELDLSNAMALDEPTYPVTTTLRFTSARPGEDTFLNYLGDSVESVVINGISHQVAQVAGTARIAIPNVAEENEVIIRSHSRYSHSGEDSTVSWTRWMVRYISILNLSRQTHAESIQIWNNPT